MKFSRIALIGAATTLAVAQPQHNHARLHDKRGTQVEARDVTYTQHVDGPVVTVYELNGKVITDEEVQAGVKSGKYIIVGDSIQAVAPSATPTPSSTAVVKPSPVKAPASLQETPYSSATPTSSSSTSIASKPTSSTVATSAPTTSDSSSDGSGDVKAEFPSGQVPCSTFPSTYGAVGAKWLGLNLWTGIQRTPSYRDGDLSISEIHTAVSGGCVPNSFCSYACPPGHSKSQFPSAQGNTGQSIGGLYCNSNGMLELSRPSYKTLCQPGAGGVTVTNKLSKNVAICRTDYPGTEAETVALDSQPGSTHPVTNPLASEYYTWEGSATSAQYYINPAGVSVDDACQWGTAGSNMGNDAPVNIGVGKTAAGTFVSLFQNSPTNTKGKLDFTITITGDVSGKCKYTGGQYYNNGVVSPTGCTTAVTDGGSAVFEFS